LNLNVGETAEPPVKKLKKKQRSIFGAFSAAATASKNSGKNYIIIKFLPHYPHSCSGVAAIATIIMQLKYHAKR
jgi:hypothetical protein